MGKIPYFSFLLLAVSIVFSGDRPLQDLIGSSLLYFVVASVTFLKLSKERPLFSAWLWAFFWPLSMLIFLLRPTIKVLSFFRFRSGIQESVGTTQAVNETTPSEPRRNDKHPSVYSDPSIPGQERDIRNLESHIEHYEKRLKNARLGFDELHPEVIEKVIQDKQRDLANKKRQLENSRENERRRRERDSYK
jgi:hypothetical protein